MTKPALPKLKLKPSKNLLLLASVVIVVLLALIPSAYFYNQYRQLKNPTVLAESEVKSIVEKVGKLIELPKGENPTVATVSDKSKLADQAFFVNAQNGDKVLIYTTSKKAILYRPSTNKIIEVAPVNLGANQGTPSASPEKEKVYKVALLNGTTTVGLTKKYEAKLLTDFKNLEVIAKENASKSDYKETVVVNLTNADSGVANSLSTAVGGKVGALPEGEQGPEGTDFLVILAK